VAPQHRLTVESGNVKERIFDEEMTANDQCGICLSDFKAGDNVQQIDGGDKCKHMFCKGCLEQWAAIGNNCPTCRYTPAQG